MIRFFKKTNYYKYYSRAVKRPLFFLPYAIL